LTTSKVGIFGRRRLSFRLPNKPGRSKVLQAYFSLCRYQHNEKHAESRIMPSADQIQQLEGLGLFL
jgi:hypothetical protein